MKNFNCVAIDGSFACVQLRGWDDPRILTINGLRRRGYTPKAINDFCQSIGVTRKDNVIQMELLEHCCRNDLDANTQRRFGVLRPLKLVLTNVADDYYEELEVSNHPKVSLQLLLVLIGLLSIP